jgi:hypothetical protein
MKIGLLKLGFEKIMRKWLLLNGLSALLFFSCGSPNEKAEKEPPLVPHESILTGKQLSQKYCQSCHLYPEPSSLDKHTWERSVLPLMGRFMGIYEDIVPRIGIIKGAINKKSVEEQNIFPNEPLIPEEEWTKISEYYISEAPDPQQFSRRKDREFSEIEGFEIVKPSLGKNVLKASLVKIDPENAHVYLGGSMGSLGNLTILNRDLEIIDQIKLPTPPTDVHISQDRLALTLSGSLKLAPSNNSFGELIYLQRNPGEEKYSSFSRFLNALNRPVQTIIEDLNDDGREDMLIAEFGYYTGSLTFYENMDGERNLYKKKVLKNVPGVIKTYVRDMNGDGLKDIITLFAQGDEGISIFYNQGKEGYKEERVLRFNPTFGSVYFELVDMNRDGFLDILYCNGDNGDYPPVLKDYHGIRIYENDGQNNFEQVYFYPMDGAFKCSAADFRLNGELDIIAISYFPDFRSKERQDLVYLKNQGNYSFSPQILKENIPGRWVTFDIGDLDGNGYKDIVFGASGVYKNQNQNGSAEYAEKVNHAGEVNSLLMLKNRGN